MKAYVLHDINNLQLENIPEPTPSAHEVLVKVEAVGICGSDIPRIYRDGAHKHPLVPGHEFAGTVVELGEKTDVKWKNKRVGIFPLIPCRSCVPCQRKQYEMCRNYSYLGSRCDGGFAEYVVVPETNLIELPDNVSFEEAAMLEPMAVAVHAMRRVAPAVTDTVAICGLGTIGLLLYMFLREVGIKDIYVIGNKDFQKNILINLGLSRSCYCDSRSEDVNAWIMKHTDGIGVDVFFECVGKNETMNQAVELTAPAGKVMLVGNPYSDMELTKNLYWKILRNQLTVLGTWNSSFTGDESDDWHYVIERLAQKVVEPSKLISHRFSLEDLEKGLHIMRDKPEDYVKIMNILK